MLNRRWLHQRATHLQHVKCSLHQLRHAREHKHIPHRHQWVFVFLSCRLVNAIVQLGRLRHLAQADITVEVLCKGGLHRSERQIRN